MLDLFEYVSFLKAQGFVTSFSICIFIIHICFYRTRRWVIKTERCADDVGVIESINTLYSAERIINIYLKRIVEYTQNITLKLNKRKRALLYVLLWMCKDIGVCIFCGLQWIKNLQFVDWTYVWGRFLRHWNQLYRKYSSHFFATPFNAQFGWALKMDFIDNVCMCASSTHNIIY